MSLIRWAALTSILAGLLWSGVGRARTASVDVCPSGCEYAVIQRAIEGASPGETIRIEPGTYKENLVITKNLTLQGADRERTVIKGARKGEPVILIEDRPAAAEGESIIVRIEGLTITAGQPYSYCRYWPVCADGILVRGRARVTIINNIIPDNGWEGIAVWDRAQVTIEGNRFSANRRCHIGLWGSAQATIQENQLLKHGDDGIELWDLSQATIQGNRILGNLYGLKLRDFAQATIDGNSIGDSEWNGLELRDSAQAVISDNQISGNGRDGLQLRDSSQASIVHNKISANGEDGVVVWRGAQVSLANNTITGNRDGVLLGRALEEGAPQAEGPLKLWGNDVFDNSGWGIALYTMACGFAGAPQAFAGTIQGSENKIHDNGRGNLCPPYPGSPWPKGFLKGSTIGFMEMTAGRKGRSLNFNTDTGPSGKRKLRPSGSWRT